MERGRPKKQDDTKRSSTLRVRLREDEINLVKSAAKEAGMTVSALIREALDEEIERIFRGF